MSNPDRLTGLDASFLALEKDGAHMHVGSVLLFEGPAPDYDAFVARDRARPAPRAALPPAARVPAVRRLAARVGRRSALQRRATTSATRRCPRPAGEEQLRRARGAGVLPAARPREAAVGDLARRQRRRRALRADLQDPPRARGRDLGRGHHDRALRPRAGPAGARARRRRGRARPLPGAARSCSRPRWRSGWRRRSGSLRGVLAAPGQRGRRRGPRRRRAGRDGRRGRSRARRRARSTCGSARTGGSRGPRPTWRRSRRSRTRWAGRSTTSS